MSDIKFEIKKELLPLAEIYTPNLPEAELLLKTTVKTKDTQ